MRIPPRNASISASILMRRLSVPVLLAALAGGSFGCTAADARLWAEGMNRSFQEQARQRQQAQRYQPTPPPVEVEVADPCKSFGGYPWSFEGYVTNEHGEQQRVYSKMNGEIRVCAAY